MAASVGNYYLEHALITSLPSTRVELLSMSAYHMQSTC